MRLRLVPKRFPFCNDLCDGMCTQKPLGGTDSFLSPAHHPPKQLKSADGSVDVRRRRQDFIDTVLVLRARAVLRGQEVHSEAAIHLQLLDFLPLVLVAILPLLQTKSLQQGWRFLKYIGYVDLTPAP